ncbi:MAG: hypothetical protein ACQER9_00900 [Nanobdellota archaeon]
MAKFIPLNSKLRKNFLGMLKEYYGIEYKPEDIIFKTEKNRYYFVNKKINEIADLNLNFRILGTYLVEINKFGEVRLSIEGSQYFGPYARKRLLELNKEKASKYLQGEDIEIKEITENELNNHYHIIYYLENEKRNFIGCGKVKDGILMNFTPKNRRIKID